ncbi:MAG: DJ-1/PfpI/YhbO family deglycase/protease [Candidatus Omnitrophica bacterium]|nr:DJ-1/PfpI/YhbO family deglycase/protease [Candidatus Omnitrophota bacterium]
MAKIAVILEDMFEDSEYTEPVKAFREAGHETVNVGLEEAKEVKGKKEGTPATIDRALGQVNSGDYDALLIPGGYSPDKLRAHESPIEFVKGFMDEGKPVFSICHGAQLLISADALKGKKATGWKSIKQDIKNAGAEYLDREVVEDGNLVSSRQPQDLPAFIKASLSKL